MFSGWIPKEERTRLRPASAAAGLARRQVHGWAHLLKRTAKATCPPTPGRWFRWQRGGWRATIKMGVCALSGHFPLGSHVVYVSARSMPARVSQKRETETEAVC